jgi:hypothetical protein
MFPDHYHLADRGQGLGVRAASEILAGLATGRLSPDVLSWREGEAAWIPLRARPEFASGLSAGASLVAPPPVLPWEAALTRWAAWPRLGDFGRTARAVLFRPAATFSAAGDDGLRAPLQWLVWSSLAAILVGFPLWSLLVSFRPAFLAAFGMKEAAAPAIFNLTYFLRALAVYPAALLVVAFVGAFVLQGLLRMTGGGAGGWRRTFRAIAYVLGALCFIAAVPVVACAAPLWGLCLLGLALGYAHREPAWRGFIALVLIGGGGCCGGLAAALWSYSHNFMR